MNGIGRIFNLSNAFGVARQSSSADRDPQQGGQGYSRQKQQHNPSEDEAKKAFEILLAMESVKKNGLQVELTSDDSISGKTVYILLVKNAQGTVLRGLRGVDILKLIEQGTEQTDAPESGRILDKRI